MSIKSVVISSGHGSKIRGAAGPEPWGLDEVDEARRVVARVVELFKGVGVSGFALAGYEIPNGS